MKISPRDTNNFVQKPPAHIAVILIYGPDNGLMRERAKLCGQSAVADLNDPFNVVTLNMDILSEDPAKLNDEANAISMMGGKRLVRIEGAKDTLKKSLEDYLENPNENALIVIEAGELRPTSSMRKLCEKHDKAAVIACYVENERDIMGLIRSMTQEKNLQIAPDAAGWLAGNIVGDRGRARSEIDKLITYMGAETNITLEDVQNCCGIAGAQSMDNLIYSVAGGNSAATFKAFNTLLSEGLPVIAILRGLQNHFRRLHLARAHMDDGVNADSAMKALRPPVFFKSQDQFRAQIMRWRLPVLEKILKRLTQLEAQCKTTGMPVETLCSQALLAISAIK